MLNFYSPLILLQCALRDQQMAGKLVLIFHFYLNFALLNQLNVLRYLCFQDLPTLHRY